MILDIYTLFYTSTLCTSSRNISRHLEYSNHHKILKPRCSTHTQPTIFLTRHQQRTTPHSLQSTHQQPTNPIPSKMGFLNDPNDMHKTLFGGTPSKARGAWVRPSKAAPFSEKPTRRATICSHPNQERRPSTFPNEEEPPRYTVREPRRQFAPTQRQPSRQPSQRQPSQFFDGPEEPRQIMREPSRQYGRSQRHPSRQPEFVDEGAEPRHVLREPSRQFAPTQGEPTRRPSFAPSRQASQRQPSFALTPSTLPTPTRPSGPCFF